MNNKIYLDNNATTAADPAVIEAMVEVYRLGPSNPSSIHSWGQEARSMLTAARREIAEHLGVKPRELVFTSSGTEALNMLVRPDNHRHIITSNLEHAAVFNILNDRDNVTALAPGEQGAVTAEALRDAIRPDTDLIVLMAVNNETGAKTDLDAIAAIAHDAGIPLVVDGVAWVGKEPIAIPSGVSAMAFSAHKFHGPRGIGGTYISRSFNVDPLIIGGGQEQGRRSGTEDLPAIVAMAKAFSLLPEQEMVTTLRDRLEQNLIDSIPDIAINGTGPRIGNTTNIAFGGVDGESLLMTLDMEGIAASHGAACASGALEPSRVLRNMHYDAARAGSSIRFSLSRNNTQAEVDRAADIIGNVVRRLRG